MKLLLTGVAGFIGMHVALRLLKDGHEVVGVDNLNNYYDVNLKHARLRHIGSPKHFQFKKIDIGNKDSIDALFDEFRPEVVINLAAQAGVRYSLENPRSYIHSNIVGFTNILEACRHCEVNHLVYASSSSVYGLNEDIPFHEGQNVDHPLALYGATKKANEGLAHSYSHLFGLPTTGLRLFTVYGPWGRPDMALFKFTDAILNNRPIEVFNHGKMVRDFTYIDDIVEGVVRLAAKPATVAQEFDTVSPDAGSSNAPWRIFNLGNGQPTSLMDYISALEKTLGIEAKKNFMDMQQGDVLITSADTKRLAEWIDFKPYTPVDEGVEKFVKWYKIWHKSL